MKVGLLVCGSPGVGKTSHISQMLKYAKLSEPIENIDPDNFKNVDIDEREKVGLERVSSAIEEGRNFVYTVICRNKWNIQKIIDLMKRKKYKVIMSITYTSKHTALKRVLERKDQPISQEVAKHLYDSFKKHAKSYMNIPQIDDLFLFNNESTFSMILHKHKKKITCNHLSDFYFDVSEYCS